MEISPDTQARKDLISTKFIEIYDNSPEIWVQAPGRVDLMGSHTDYNEGFVLTQAIDRNTWIAARPRKDGRVRICSLNAPGCSEFDLQNLTHDEATPWTNYVRGVADILQQEGYTPLGFDGLVHSTIPFGSGLSSSAALEVATATLFQALGRLQIDPVVIAKMCQRAENEFVGLNCGILDQYSSAMGKAGSVLLLDCRTITHETKPIAPGLQVMICDTRAERALTGSEYPERRAQCELGVRILTGFYPHIKNLRDATLEQLQAHQSDLDPVVFKRCHFIIAENQRVLDVAEALASGDYLEAGRLANESFAGARDLYEIVSQEMIAMQAAIMAAPGALGTRGAGAGFGGCMVAFVESGQEDTFTQYVTRHYQASTGIEPQVYPGVAADGAGILEFYNAPG
ncbi:MAG TPA: galactokinase [Chloroflexi bacterium]|nr:galactokinase [Chloroflexota bacterium]HBY07401.1 galactokinase [Chloroflexota bacterium]